jgi:transposase-like protein
VIDTCTCPHCHQEDVIVFSERRTSVPQFTCPHCHQPYIYSANTGQTMTLEEFAAQVKLANEVIDEVIAEEQQEKK